MENETLTFTQAELDAKVEEAVANATKALEKKHNEEMYNARKEIKDLKNANLSQEDRAKKELEEKEIALGDELKELRTFKKTTILGEKLAKENLPSYFKNDNRLLTAEDGDIDRVIKDIKKEYEASLPKGNPHSTIVQQSSSQAPLLNDKDKANAEFGRALKELVG